MRSGNAHQPIIMGTKMDVSHGSRLVSTLSKGRQLFRSLHDVNDNEFDEAAMKIYEAIMMFEAIFWDT